MNKSDFIILAIVSMISAVIFCLLQGKISNTYIIFIILLFGFGIGFITRILIGK